MTSDFLPCPICGAHWIWGRDVHAWSDYRSRPLPFDDPEVGYARLRCPGLCGLSYDYQIPKTGKGKAVKNWRDLMAEEVNRRHIMAAVHATRQADEKLHSMLQEVQRTAITVWEKECKMDEDEIRRQMEQEEAGWKEDSA